MPNKKKKGFRKTKSISPRTSSSNTRSKHRKQWTDSEMVSALDAVLTKQLPANKAAKLYGVPPSTLKDRLSGRVVHGVKPGPRPYLTTKEEKELTDHLVSAKVGYGKTRRDVMNMVETYVNSQRSNGENQKEVTVSNNQPVYGDDEPNDCASVCDECLDTPTFTVEEELKYARRYEEGYDLADVHYEAWLKLNHPLNDLLPYVGVASYSSSVTSNDRPGAVQRSPQASSGGAVVSPSTCQYPSVMSNSRLATVQQSPQASSGGAAVSPSTCQSLSVMSNRPAIVQRSPQASSGGAAVSPSTCHSPSVMSDNRPAIVQRSPQASSVQRSPLSELLIIPVANKPKKSVPTGKARVLTSAECLKALQDKENEKKQKAKEKEQRKEQRLLKKQQREEELKRKAEEKAHKAALREAKLLEKQSQKPTRRKQGKRTSSSMPDVAAETTHDVPTDAPVADVTTDNLTPHAPGATTDELADETHGSRGPSKRKSTSHAQPNAKRSKSSADDEIDVNRCCACFGMYADDAGTGREWLQCQCSRWIHEDCIDDDDVDVEQCIFCPLC